MTPTLRIVAPVGRNERGIALPLVMMALVVLAALTAALLAVGTSETTISANLLRGTQALYVAEAGLERAIAQFVANASLVTNADTKAVTLFSKQDLASVGTYTVTYQSVGFGTVRITSTGTSAAGSAKRTVEAAATTSFVNTFALLGDRGTKIKKQSDVFGGCGAVHDNTKMEVKCEKGSGYLCVKLTATSGTDKCDNCTDPTRVGLAESSGGGRPPVTIPSISPLSFTPDYTLGDDGKILDKTGAVLYDGKKDKANTGWNGWNQGGKGEWRNDSDTIPDGVYYAPKRIRITGNPGSPSAPWKATLLSGDSKHKGTVDIRGAVVMEPASSTLPLIVAGKVKVKWKKADEDEENASDAARAAEDADAASTDDPDDKKDGDDEAAEDTDDEAAEPSKVRPRTYVDLTGSIIGSSAKSKDAGKSKARVKLTGDVRLKGNVTALGRIELKGADVTYDCKNPPQLTGGLQLFSWSTRSQ